MEASAAKSNKRVYYKPYDRKTLLIIAMFVITCISLPGNVKCDMGDTIASMLLFMIITIFVCAGIGWWSRRQEGKI